jgi:hypothetical protein
VTNAGEERLSLLVAIGGNQMKKSRNVSKPSQPALSLDILGG